MKTIPPLTPEQQALVGTENILRLAGHLTRHYRRWYRNYDDELRSAALLGAVRAAESYRNINDPKTFMTFAHYWMRGFMNLEGRQIRRHGIKYGRGDLKPHGEMKRRTFEDMDLYIEPRECPDITEMLNRVSRYLNAHEEKIIRKVYGEGLSIPQAAACIPSERRRHATLSHHYARQLHRTALEKIRKYFPTPLHLMYGAA